MTKIKMAVSAALVAAAGLLGTQTALASTSPAVAPSDLFAAVWNSVSNTSVVIDLGTTWSSLNSTSTFQSSAGYTQSWDLSALSGGTITSVGAANEFSVFAGNNSTAPNQFFVGLTSAGTAPLMTTPSMGGFFNSVNPYITNWLPGSTTSHLSTLAPGTGSDYWANNGNPFNPGVNGGSYNIFALNNVGAATPGTGSLNFFEYTAGLSTRSNASSAAIGNSAGAGVFTLNGNTLTYTLAAASAVPLPAAGWLLLSGLLGLGAVGRRRDAAVAA